MALDENGNVFCWGDNFNGKCGDGETHNISTPKMVKGLEQEHIIEIKAGSNHSAAITKSQKIYLWGKNYNYQRFQSNPLFLHLIFQS